MDVCMADGLLPSGKFEVDKASFELFCGSPAPLPGLSEKGDGGLGEGDIKPCEAVIAAKKLAGSGTGDCFGGIL